MPGCSLPRHLPAVQRLHPLHLHPRLAGTVTSSHGTQSGRRVLPHQTASCAQETSRFIGAVVCSPQTTAFGLWLVAAKLFAAAQAAYVLPARDYGFMHAGTCCQTTEEAAANGSAVPCPAHAADTTSPRVQLAYFLLQQPSLACSPQGCSEQCRHRLACRRRAVRLRVRD